MCLDGFVSVLTLLLSLTAKELMMESPWERGTSYSLTTMNGRPCSSLMTEAVADTC